MRQASQSAQAIITAPGSSSSSNFEGSHLNRESQPSKSAAGTSSIFESRQSNSVSSPASTKTGISIAVTANSSIANDTKQEPVRPSGSARFAVILSLSIAGAILFLILLARCFLQHRKAQRDDDPWLQSLSDTSRSIRTRSQDSSKQGFFDDRAPQRSRSPPMSQLSHILPVYSKHDTLSQNIRKPWETFQLPRRSRDQDDFSDMLDDYRSSSYASKQPATTAADSQYFVSNVAIASKQLLKSSMPFQYRISPPSRAGTRGYSTTSIASDRCPASSTSSERWGQAQSIPSKSQQPSLSSYPRSDRETVSTSVIDTVMS